MPASGLVFDSSAWVRSGIEPARATWKRFAREGRLALCPVVALELCATARDEAELLVLEAGLARMPLSAPITVAAGHSARSVLRELGARRRLPATEYLIAASAAERGFGVLHYDHHFDALCEALGIESVWVAPPGSVD